MERIELFVPKIDPWAYFVLLVKLRLRRFGWLYGIFCFIGLFQLTSSVANPEMDHLGILLLSFPLIMAAFLCYWAYRKDNHSMLEERHFVIDQEKLVGTGRSGSRGEIPWSSIQRVVEIDDKFLLYISADQMIILPKSVFDDQGMLDQFRSWLQAAQMR